MTAANGRNGSAPGGGGEGGAGGRIAGGIVRNTIWNGAGRVLAMAASFVLTPVVIAHVGLEKFAIWAIVSMVTGCFGLFDLGMSLSFVKYIAEAHAREDLPRLDRVVSTGIAFYLLFAAAACLAGCGGLDLLVRLLRIDVTVHPEIRTVLALAILIFCAQTVLALHSSVLVAIQRMDVTNRAAAFATAFHFLAAVAMLRAGFGLIGLMAASAIFVGTQNLICVRAVRTLLPAMRIRPVRSFDRDTFRELFAFGFKMHVVRVSNLITQQIDKWLIGVLFSLPLLSFYHLGATIAHAVFSLVTVLVSALAPAFVEMEARGDRARLREASLHALGYLALLTVPLYGMTFVAADRLMILWMGSHEYGGAATVLRILLAGHWLTALSLVPANVCVALGKPDPIAGSAILMIALNLGASLAAARFAGFPWIAFGSSFALGAGALYLISRASRELGVPGGAFLAAVSPQAAAGLASALALFALDLALAGRFAGAGRMPQAALLVCEGAAFALLYAGICRAAGIAGPRDIGYLLDALRRGRGGSA